jgi:putative ABC transport system permease protein
MLTGLYGLDEDEVNAKIEDVDNQCFIKSKWKEENTGVDITTLGPLSKTVKMNTPRL